MKRTRKAEGNYFEIVSRPKPISPVPYGELGQCENADLIRRLLDKVNELVMEVNRLKVDRL